MNLIATLALAAGAFLNLSPKPADYSGAWILDAAKSSGLPSYYSRVKSHSLHITQTSDTLDVAVSVDAGGPAPQTFDFHYPLDGSEAVTETALRIQNSTVNVPTKLKAEVKPDGGLHITITRTIPMGAQSMEAVGTEDWSLSPDGKTLTVDRVDDTPRGKMSAKMVFLKS